MTASVADSAALQLIHPNGQEGNCFLMNNTLVLEMLAFCFNIQSPQSWSPWPGLFKQSLSNGETLAECRVCEVSAPSPSLQGKYVKQVMCPPAY